MKSKISYTTLIIIKIIIRLNDCNFCEIMHCLSSSVIIKIHKLLNLECVFHVFLIFLWIKLFKNELKNLSY